jgi:hypothetical protein
VEKAPAVKGEQEKFQNEMFAILLPPGGGADMVGSILYINELIAKRQKKYFPDLKEFIVDYESIVSDSDITLNISSAPVETKNNPKQFIE